MKDLRQRPGQALRLDHGATLAPGPVASRALDVVWGGLHNGRMSRWTRPHGTTGDMILSAAAFAFGLVAAGFLLYNISQDAPAPGFLVIPGLMVTGWLLAV